MPGVHITHLRRYPILRAVVQAQKDRVLLAPPRLLRLLQVNHVRQWVDLGHPPCHPPSVPSGIQILPKRCIVLTASYGTASLCWARRGLERCKSLASPSSKHALPYSTAAPTVEWASRAYNTNHHEFSDLGTDLPSHFLVYALQQWPNTTRALQNATFEQGSC